MLINRAKLSIGKHIAKVAMAVLVTVGVSATTIGLTVSNAQAEIRVTQNHTDRHAGEFVVPVNKSQILRLDQRISDLLVGSAEIADVLAITDRSIYILGKKIGSTSLTVYGAGKRLIAVMELTVTHDISGLKERLFELMPNEKIEVRPASEGIVLSGTVSSASAMSRAMTVAEQYVPENVSNLMSVAGSQQVMLSVRFAEVARTTAKELGLNAEITSSDFSITSGDALLSGLISTTAFATGALTGSFGSFAFTLLFDALEEKGMAKTLAEPNLIALSGDTATFLAGGEFPVPVARDFEEDGRSTITVEFKEFGVALAFTPTVLDDGLVNVAVSPEVSRIDPNNSVVVSGFNIPGITTRRATTTVELRDGQSFAIAGLIQSDFEDTIRQFPGFGDVPVLGGLLRSTNYQRKETELVIIVTVRLVKPAEAGTLAAPTDGFRPPSDLDMFLFGRTESPESGSDKADGGHRLSARNSGGIVGQYGHIIR